MVTVGYNSSSGKVLWGTGGKLCIGCCDIEGLPCSGCPTPPPYTIKATLSGMDSGICSCCYRKATGVLGYSYFADVKVKSLSVDGVYTLQNTASCAYDYPGTPYSNSGGPGASGTWGYADVYSSKDGSCTGTILKTDLIIDRLWIFHRPTFLDSGQLIVSIGSSSQLRDDELGTLTMNGTPCLFDLDSMESLTDCWNGQVTDANICGSGNTHAGHPIIMASVGGEIILEQQ